MREKRANSYKRTIHTKITFITYTKITLKVKVNNNSISVMCRLKRDLHWTVFNLFNPQGGSYGQMW